MNKEGGIVTQTMPEDYAEKADTLDLRLKHIKVRILNPVDIILTKVGRCNRKDIDDILKIAKKYKIEKQDLMNRFDEYLKSYDGSKNALKGNFRHVCEILYE
ncbi:MAG: DUF6036 family nucleotidyltransferase [Candidatus Woesearchaeota archaeon]|nr:DUF6036 family nucleotidyltransferase [Candidatus Woesearchaeota archaeon]